MKKCDHQIIRLQKNTSFTSYKNDMQLVSTSGYVNDTKFIFVLDTGATKSIISNEVNKNDLTIYLDEMILLI